MTTPAKILVELLDSQATSDALAERLRVPMLTIKAICERHEKDGLLTHTKAADCLVVWVLTEAGHDVASSKQPAPTAAVA